jgi:hypothetical protein
MRHSVFNRSGDTAQRSKMKDEIEGYLKLAYHTETEDGYKDVYITDHVAKQKKFATQNE